VRLEHLLSGDQTNRILVTISQGDLEQPWLVRYQFYLFELILLEEKLQASKLGCKPKLKA